MSNMDHSMSTADDDGPYEDENEMLDADDADEVVEEDEDAHMDSDDAGDGAEGDEPLEELQIQNDSAAHFDAHIASVFCIAQHPTHPEIVATGGGDDVGYIFDSTPPEKPLLPPSYSGNPNAGVARESLPVLYKLEGHTDSLNAMLFTLPRGEYVVSAGLDGKIRTWRDGAGDGRSWSFVAEAQEVEEINFLAACPHPDYSNAFALGANDGSVWVYTVNANDKASPLTIVQAFYLHTGSCTAGAWTPDGKLLATVSEDGTLYVWDVFGEGAAAGLTSPTGSQALVGLTPQDERFKIEGGLYSIAISPNGALVAVGGAEGQIRVVGLPRLGGGGAEATTGTGAGARSKAGGSKQAGGSKAGAASAAAAASSAQAGQILASLGTQKESVETIAFAPSPLTLMAAGSVDGSIVLFDAAHRFAVRRHIRDAHEEEAVIKVDFVHDAHTNETVLTSCGNDGVVRRWTPKGGTAAAGQGMLGEWRGHRGGMGDEDGEDGGGILDFVQGGGRYVVTAGDE